jgi:hypothetical protein
MSIRVPRAVVREWKLRVLRARAPFVRVQKVRVVLLAREGAGPREITRRVGSDDFATPQRPRQAVDACTPQ